MRSDGGSHQAFAPAAISIVSVRPASQGAQSATAPEESARRRSPPTLMAAAENSAASSTSGSPPSTGGTVTRVRSVPRAESISQ